MRILTTLLFSLLTFFSWAQDGFEIQVSIDGYTENQLSLAYYLGDKQYIQDTVDRADDGTYTFSGEEALPGGIYLVVMAPDNNFFQLLVDEKNQRFKVATEVGEKQLAATKFVNSADNARFYEYLQFLANQRTRGNELQEKAETETDEAKKAALQKELEGLGERGTRLSKKRSLPKTPQVCLPPSSRPTFLPTYPIFQVSPKRTSTKRSGAGCKNTTSIIST